MTPEGNAHPPVAEGFSAAPQPLTPVETARPVAMLAAPVANASEAEATLAQLSKVVSEFMVKYPSHTQRIPSIRPGEHALIAFVRQMAASMANKQEELETLNEEV